MKAWVRIALALLIALPVEAAEFRTPARRYSGAYSIKVTLVQQGQKIVIPVWVKPDQEKSTLDPGQIVYTGWDTRTSKAEEVILSGVSIGPRQFAWARSDWAVAPEYPKNCCFGVIGRDILDRFKLRFVPGDPSHIEWVEQAEKPGIPLQKRARKKADFEKSLAALFSLRSEIVRVSGSRYDLSVTPFEVDFTQARLSFDGAPFEPRVAKANPVFQFEFSSFGRDLEVKGLHGANQGLAKDLGFFSGTRVLELDGRPVSGMTRQEIESILHGRKGKRVEISFWKDNGRGGKNRIVFDFDKNVFTKP